jgi:5-methylcytosine-specific restriction endonuclease McrA
VSLSSIPSSLRREVQVRDRGRCAYCHLQQFGQASAFHVDHILPRSKGGQTIPENLTLQCPNCSLRKSDKTDADDPETKLPSPLFHPLRDQWDEHFAILADGTCQGITAIGRATIVALRMNDPVPRAARLIQLALGIL